MSHSCMFSLTNFIKFAILINVFLFLVLIAWEIILCFSNSCTKIVREIEKHMDKNIHKILKWINDPLK